MNKTQFYTLSGALLASTALASVANAGIVGRTATPIVNTLLTTTPLTISTLAFGGTTAVANAVAFPSAGAVTFGVALTNNLPLGGKFNATVNVVGANFITTNMGTLSIAVIVRTAGQTFAGTVQGACTAIVPLVDKVLINNCDVSATQTAGTWTAGTHFMGGLQLSGVIFNNAATLASAGNAITFNGIVVDNANPATTIENITSGSVITSAAPIAAAVTAGANVVANANTTPTSFTNLSVTNNGNGNLSMTLATITLTSTGALATDLATLVTPALAATSLTVTVTDTVFTSAAVTKVGFADFVSTATTSQFIGGSVTFSLTTATTVTLASSTAINVSFNGTTAIPVAAAGSVSVLFGSGSLAAPLGLGTITGSTAAISQGGFTSEVNTFQSSASPTFQSFIRIHNNGSVAGSVTVTVVNDANTSGAALGTPFTSASIKPGSTLQLSNRDIETAAGITSPSGQYTVKVSGPIIGYVQHIIYNSATGQLADLSAFRNAGNVLNNAP